MRKMTPPTVPVFKLRMLVPRVVYSIPREVDDEVDVQEPLAGILLEAGYAEKVEDSSAETKLKLTAKDPIVTKSKKGKADE